MITRLTSLFFALFVFVNTMMLTTIENKELTSSISTDLTLNAKNDTNESSFDLSEIEKAEVELRRLYLNRSSGVNKGWQYLILGEPDTLDLLTIQKDLAEILPEITPSAGTYDQIVFLVSNAKIKLKDDRTSDLLIRGGASSGLRVSINPPVYLEPDSSQKLSFEVDVSKSFVLNNEEQLTKNAARFEFSSNLTVSNLTEYSSGDNNSGLLSDSDKRNSIQNISEKNDTYGILAVSAGTYTIFTEIRDY